jgi:hypothetical protein
MPGMTADFYMTVIVVAVVVGAVLLIPFWRSDDDG